MNRNDFLSLIEKSGPSDRQMIGEINELINIFPYFHSAYMLMLKGLQNTSDVRFGNQLRTYAIYIADRVVLYYFLKKEQEPVPQQKIAIQPTLNSLPEPTDNQQTVIESGKNSDDMIEEIEKSEGGVTTERVTDDKSILVSGEIENDESDSLVLYIDEETNETEEKIVYMDPGFSVPEPQDLLEIENNLSILHEEERTKDDTEIQISDSVVTDRQIQAELIEKFILANPRIEPSRIKTEVPAVDIAAPFTEAKGEFVTETLAKIYVRQGYYSKAVEIFEKLSLKFPEKSSYFASQIEKVKELIK